MHLRRSLQHNKIFLLVDCRLLYKCIILLEKRIYQIPYEKYKFSRNRI